MSGELNEEQKPIIIFGADPELADDFKDWMDKHAGGDWRTGTRMLLDWAETKPILSSLFREVAELRELLVSHLQEHEPESNENEDGIRTFGGTLK